MNLYEITGVYIDLQNQIEAGDIPEEAIADTLEAVEGMFEEKIDNTACLFKNISAQVAAIEAEKKNLEQRLKTLEGSRDRLKDYIRDAMTTAGKNKVETARNSVKLGAVSESVKVVDAEALKARNDVWAPYKYTASNVRKEEVKKLLAAGEDIQGVEIKRTARLTIK